MAGVAVGVGIAVASGVAVGVGVGVGVGVAIGTSVGAGVAEAVGSGVAVGPAVGAGVAVGAAVGAGVGAADPVLDETAELLTAIALHENLIAPGAALLILIVKPALDRSATMYLITPSNIWDCAASSALVTVILTKGV